MTSSSTSTPLILLRLPPPSTFNLQLLVHPRALITMWVALLSTDKHVFPIGPRSATIENLRNVELVASPPLPPTHLN